jgi:aminopeptidase-like protein
VTGLTVREAAAAVDLAAAGKAMHELMAELWPICRSITGDGVRATLAVLGDHIDLQIQEVPTGTKVFDWTVPREWNIRDAWIEDAAQRRVVDFQVTNLHVLNYSVPVDRRLSLQDLRQHLHTLPEQPDWIPYRTSYYAENWGFCLSQRQLDALPDGDYRAVIDSTLADGSLTYAECIVPGTTPDEVLVSCHTCHPSLANDNLSGVVLTTFLAKALAKATPRYTYRFLFIPGTIGSIVWLARNQEQASRIRAGLVLACVGDPGMLHYKQSRRGDTLIDRAVENVLASSGNPFAIVDFSPYGYDERQFCSPGFDLPVGCLNRTPYAQFPEYHSSADNLDFVRPDALAGSLQAVLAALRVLEEDATYRNLTPMCEPQLGRRGLYGAIGGRSDAEQFQMALLWVLNQSDGAHSLLDIAERSGMSFALLAEAATALVEVGLLLKDEEPTR